MYRRSLRLRLKLVTTNAPKWLLQCKSCHRLGHTQRNCGCALRCVACGYEHPSGKGVTPKQQLKCCSCEGNHTANYRGCSKWKEVKAAAAKRAQAESNGKDGVCTRLPAPKSAQAKHSSEQDKLGHGRNHVVRSGRVVKTQATPSPAQLHPAQEDGPRGRLPQREFKDSPLVLKCWCWNPSHPVPNRPSQHPLFHRVRLNVIRSPIPSRIFPIRPVLS
jgi:hypothetical protein